MSRHTPLTSFTITQSLEERRIAIDHHDQAQKKREAAKQNKEMSSSPSSPSLRRGPRKVLDIARFFEPGPPSSRRPDILPVADNNTTQCQATIPSHISTPSTPQMSEQVTSLVQPMRGQRHDHVIKIARDEPTRARNIRTDQNPDEGGHFEGQYQPDVTH